MAIGVVVDVSFLFQNAQQGANRRVAGRIGQRGLNLGGRGAAAAIKKIQNLALAAA